MFRVPATPAPHLLGWALLGGVHMAGRGRSSAEFLGPVHSGPVQAPLGTGSERESLSPWRWPGRREQGRLGTAATVAPEAWERPGAGGRWDS